MTASAGAPASRFVRRRAAIVLRLARDARSEHRSARARLELELLRCRAVLGDARDRRRAALRRADRERTDRDLAKLISLIPMKERRELDEYRRRWRQPLPPPKFARRQFVELMEPSLDRAARRSIGDARFVVIGDPKAARRLDLIPVLLSGRPLAVRSQAGEETRYLPTVEELLTRESTALEHLATSQLRQVLRADSPDRPPAPISVVLVSNRPDRVRAAIEQLQRQVGVEVEALIGLHGFDEQHLDLDDIRTGAIRTATVTSFPTSVVFGKVLDELSGRARHDHISKWDDDDLYGPHHLLDLWLGITLLGAPMVGKAAEFARLEGSDALVRRTGGPRYAPSRFLAGGALLMTAKALEIAGGWPGVPRSVDQELIRLFRCAGLPTFRIHGFEFVLVRHGRGHTWAADDEYFLRAGDLAWTADSIDRAGLFEAPRAPVGSTPGRRRPLRRAVCVPLHQDPSAAELWRIRTEELTRSGIDVVVADDRNDPALTMSGTEAHVVRVHDGEGFGAGRARAAAAEANDAEVMFFVDADVEVRPDVFETIGGWYDAGYRGAVHARIGFTTIDNRALLRHVRADGATHARLLAHESATAGQLWREPHWATSADLAHPHSTCFRSSVGAFIAVDRQTYTSSGGWRDVPVRGVEDVEFGYRLLTSGSKQRVYRGSGVTHLGSQTFSSVRATERFPERESWLAALIPVWTRSSEDRHRLLDGWTGSITPFAAVEHEIPAAAPNGLFATMATPPDPMRAPFCIGLDVDEDHAALSASVAQRAFFERRCGEVVITAGDGTTVGRYIAVWALRHVDHPSTDGSALDLESATHSPELLSAVRRRFGAVWIRLPARP